MWSILISFYVIFMLAFGFWMHKISMAGWDRPDSDDDGA